MNPPAPLIRALLSRMSFLDVGGLAATGKSEACPLAGGPDGGSICIPAPRDAAHSQVATGWPIPTQRRDREEALAGPKAVQQVGVPRLHGVAGPRLAL